jgi:hypothetical protein
VRKEGGVKVGLIALVLTLPSLPAAAQTASAAAPGAPAVQPANPTAKAFIGLFLDEKSLLARVDRDIPAYYRSSPKFAALEADYPGITDYVIGRMLPGSEQRALHRLHVMSGPMAAYLSANMPEADLAQVVAFYRSPVGTKMIDILRQMNGAPMLQSMAGKVGQATGEDLEKGADATIAANGGIATKLTKAELDEIVHFLATDAGKKWKAIQPGFSAFMADLSNQEAQTSLPVVRAETASAIADYERDHPKKVSS